MDHAVFSYLVRCFLESCHLYNYKPVIMPSLHLYYIFRDFCVSSQKTKTKTKNLEIAGDKRSLQSCYPGYYYSFWHQRSQHSFGLPLKLNGIRKTPSGYAHLDFLSLVICSRTFLPSISEIYAEQSALEQERFDLR